MLKKSIKSQLSRYPALYDKAAHVNGVVRGMQREVRTLRLIGPRLLLSRLFPKRDLWRSALPVQQAQNFVLTTPKPLSDIDTIKEYMGMSDEVPEGWDSFYISPEKWQASPIAWLQSRYPAGCGLKIGKNKGGVESSYVTMHPGRKFQSHLGATHSQQQLMFNFLYAQGVGPRLYDLIELDDEHGNSWAAYVLEHIEGTAAPVEVCRATVAKLRALQDAGTIFLNSASGWEGVDFREPDCHGNLLYSAEQERAVYVDVGNFNFDQYDRYLTNLAKEVASASHFGETSVIAGAMGRYLYQEIPGVQMPAKRSPTTRMKTYDALCAQVGLSLEGKTVLDIGCNLGLMGAEYLRRGASWYHGFDFPKVTPATQRVLLAIGCTRFSLSSVELSPTIQLADLLPAHIQSVEAKDMVISYLAIRGHVGWLPALKQLRWKYMLYEGHQTDEQMAGYMEDLNRLLSARVVATGTVADANSTPRFSAIIERLDV